jgi:hypothetical protein
VPPTTPASKCPNVADQLLSLMTATAKDAPLESLDSMRMVFTERCEQDGWSREAQECFLGLTAMTEAARCESLLTEAQVQSFGAALQSEAAKNRESTSKPADSAP